MSTGNMPNPPDTPTAPGGQVPGGSEAPPPAEEAQAQLPLPADMARILREQADTIAQQMNYHSQMMMGVSAMGTDVVNARNTVLTLADALSQGGTEDAEKAIVHLGSAQIAQVNDRTLPFKLNSQIAGLFEGLVLDTMSKAYGSDPGRAKEARALLEPLFQSANEQAQTQPRNMVLWQAPGPGPNARS
jgi:hypothetical protein